MMCANLIPINQTATTGYNVGGPWTLGVGGLWPSHLLFPERSCKMDPPIQCYHVRASPPPYSYFVRPWSDDHYNAIYLFIFLIQTPNQVSTCHAFTALPSHQHLWNSPSPTKWDAAPIVIEKITPAIERKHEISQ